MAKIERKMMAHYVDGSLTASPAYYRLGQDLEEFNVDMNPEFESVKNILGASSTQMKGYDPQSSVSPYYATEGDGLFEKLQKIIDTRATGTDTSTKAIEVHLWEESTTGVYVAYREDATFVINSYGGDTAGYQIEFDIKYNGNREKGLFTLATKTFVPDSGTLGALEIEVVAGSSATATKVTDVIGEPSGSTLYYKVGDTVSTPIYGEAAAGYTSLSLGTDIATEDGEFIVVVAIDTTVVAASPVVPVVVGT